MAQHPLGGAGATVRGVQRSRGRAGHVQGSRPHAGQPVSAPGRSAHRRVRGRRRGGVRRVEGQLRARVRPGDVGRGRDADRGHLPRLRDQRCRRPGGLPVRRGEGAARGDRRACATPALVPAVRARPVRDRHRHGLGGYGGRGYGQPGGGEPDARQQRRNVEQRAPHPGPGRRLVPFTRDCAVTGQPGVHRGGRRGRTRRRRGRARHDVGRRHRRGGCRPRRPGARSRPCCRAPRLR